MNKQGAILIENVIFIILNVVFLSIIILFLARQSSGAYILEENYAKQIALLVDYAKPDMILKLNMEKGMKVAEDNNFDFSKAVRIDGNIVYVKLRDKDGAGYSYSFFNDVDAIPYYDSEGIFVITINEKENSGGNNG